MPQSNLHWLKPNIIKEASYQLAKNSEIPRRMFEMSTNHAHFDISLEEKLIAEGKKVLYSETNLMHQEAEFIKNRVAGRNRVNLLDIGSTNGITTLPLVIELIADEDLGLYIPVTPNASVNKHAINKLKTFLKISEWGDLQYDMINVDPEGRDFHLDITQIQRDQEFESSNLFVLAGSVLGNYINPLRVLENISRSMNREDHLVIVQGIYRLGSEDALVADYDKVVEYMLDTKSVCEVLNPNYEMKISWDDTQRIHGVKVSFDIDKPTRFAGVELVQGQEVTVFRSTRFERYQLESMLKEVGLTLISLTLDRTHDNAIFFLQKS